MSNAGMSPFSEHLIKSESNNEELRHRYEKERLALTERRLSPLQRRIGWLGLPVYAGMIVGLGYIQLTPDSVMPREWKMLLTVGAFGLLAMGLWILRVLLRGGRVTWQDDRAFEWIGVIALCALGVVLFEIAQTMEDHRNAIRLYGCLTVFIVSGAFSFLLEQIRRSKLETRVRLMELELRMIDLVRSSASPPPQVPPTGS